MPEFHDVPGLHDELTRHWHELPTSPDRFRLPERSSSTGFERLLLQQHWQNFGLWHEEDCARALNVSPQLIAQTKRRIDALNQIRNDLIEAIDSELLEELRDGKVALQGELHSETPGMIIDRLSILSLKIFHTREQTERTDVSAEHIAKNRERLTILIQQRDDLAGCLTALWRDVQEGRRYFKLYRQLKMYNDPELNPEIYSAKSQNRPG
jgi:hypothetical protein